MITCTLIPWPPRSCLPGPFLQTHQRPAPCLATLGRRVVGNKAKEVWKLSYLRSCFRLDGGEGSLGEEGGGSHLQARAGGDLSCRGDTEALGRTAWLWPLGRN